MKKLFLWLLILTPILIISQNKNTPSYTISGKIIDASSKIPLEYATVIFKTLDSNKVLYGAITNFKGNFEIEVIPNSYAVIVEYMSYKPQTISLKNLKKNINLGTIELTQDSEFLKEIEVTAQKSTLQLKNNKQIFNVGKDLSANGGTATDILANIPAVSVDPNGVISLRGQQDVTVMINGNLSSMSKADVLKSLPAGSIEKVEVITNPGAQYKASSKSIINIILKKEKNEGLNGSITGSGGYKNYYGGLLTLNNKSKKVNLFTNSSYFQRNPISYVAYRNTYFSNGNATSYLNENARTNERSKAILSTVGADFYLSPKATLTTTINYTNIDSHNLSNTFSNIFDASYTSTATNNRINKGTYNDDISEFRINYEQKFAKEGQKLTTSIAYSNDKEIFTYNYKNSNPSFTNDNYNIQNVLKNTFFDVVYGNPINETSEFEMGYNGVYGKVPFTYNSPLTYNLINYKENIHAFYFIYAKQFKKVYMQAGLRGEFSQTNLFNSVTNSNLIRNYNNIFPHLSLDYNISDSNTLSLSYGSQITRPNYYVLQPYEEIISETFVYKGNELLEPMYVYSFDATYLHSSKGFTVQFSLFYHIWDNYWHKVTYETGETINGVNKLLTSYFNFGKLNHYGTSLTTIIKPAKWLQFTTDAALYRFDDYGNFSIVNSANKTVSQNFNSKEYSGSLSLLTKISLANLIDFQTKITHKAIERGADYVVNPRTYANLAVSKDILKKNATISLTASDLFDSNKINKTRFSKSHSSNAIIVNEPTVILSFTYRFNQKKQDRIINFDKKEIKRNF